MVSSHDKRIERILRKQRNADKKVSRLEHRAEPIRIRNTDENPHRSPTDIRNMSPRELASHERRLDRFTDRSNQYVPGQDNQPIRKSTAQQLQRLQEQANARTRALEQSINNIKLPGQDQTIGGLINMRQAVDGKNKGGDRIYNQKTRRLQDVEGQRAAEDLIKDLRKKNSGDYYKEVVDKRMNSIRAALNYSGQHDLVDMVDSLDPFEQHLLIDFSNFGQIAALNINSPKYSSDGSIRDDYNEEEFDGTDTQDDEEIHESLLEVLKWLKGVKRTARRNPSGGDGTANRKRRR